MILVCRCVSYRRTRASACMDPFFLYFDFSSHGLQTLSEGYRRLERAEEGAKLHWGGDTKVESHISFRKATLQHFLCAAIGDYICIKPNNVTCTISLYINFFSRIKSQNEQSIGGTRLESQKLVGYIGKIKVSLDYIIKSYLKE